MATTKPLTINRGKTLRVIVRWETTPIVRKAITAIDLAPGCPRLTVPSHGLVDKWRAACIGIVGTKELNAEDPAKLRDRDYYEVTVIDANTIELNDVNAANFTAYVSGGFLVYNTPRDLTNWTCRVKFKDKPGGAVLLSTEAVDTPNNVVSASVNNTTKSITITVPASATDDMRKSGVWEAEMADSSVEPIVEPLILVSPFSVTTEVVT